MVDSQIGVAAEVDRPVEPDGKAACGPSRRLRKELQSAGRRLNSSELMAEYPEDSAVFGGLQAFGLYGDQVVEPKQCSQRAPRGVVVHDRAASRRVR